MTVTRLREVTAILDMVDRNRERLLEAWREHLTIDDRTLEIADVHCTDQDLVVSLKDGRTIGAPLWWYPRLCQAAPEQRRNWQIA
jgi:Protein of unknown function (DUF2442)